MIKFTLAFVALSLMGCSAGTQNSSLQSDEVVVAYQYVTINGPQELIDHLEAGQVAAAKSTVRSLYYVLEAIDPSSDMYSPSMAKQICTAGISFACRNLISARDAVRKLYSNFVSSEKLSSEEVMELANEIKQSSLLEGVQ